MSEESSYELTKQIKLNHRFSLLVTGSLKPSGNIKFNIAMFNTEFQTYVRRLRSFTLSEREIGILIEAVNEITKKLREKREELGEDNEVIETID